MVTASDDVLKLESDRKSGARPKVLSEPEYQRERVIDGPHFGDTEASGGSPETFWVDDGCLFHQDPRVDTAKRDQGAEARRAGTCRGRRDQRGRQAEELIGLNDHGITRAALLSSTRSPRRRQSKRLTSDHLSPRPRVRVRPSARGSAASPFGLTRRSRAVALRGGWPSERVCVQPPLGVPCEQPRNPTYPMRGPRRARRRRHRRVSRAGSGPQRNCSTDRATIPPDPGHVPRPEQRCCSTGWDPGRSRRRCRSCRTQ
jgi:hypothetical protein